MAQMTAQLKDFDSTSQKHQFKTKLSQGLMCWRIWEARRLWFGTRWDLSDCFSRASCGATPQFGAWPVCHHFGL